MKKIINYYCEHNAPINDYVFETIFLLMGIPAKRTPHSHKDVDIYYGNDPDVNCQLSISEDKETLIVQDVLDGGELKVSQSVTAIRVEDDIINAIALLLSDKVNENVPHNNYDEHQRLHYKDSFQAKLHVQQIPIVNAYILSLQKVITDTFDIEALPLWPDNKQAAFVLSHDVDDPDKYSYIKSYTIAPPANMNRNIISYNYHIAGNALRRLMDSNRNAHWLFKEIMEVESKYGFKSTFYFASRSFFERSGHFEDVRYDIKKDKFIRLFPKLKEAGFEIGLHASYNAHEDLNNFIEEKQRLEELANISVTGLRHHFWHMGPHFFDTLHHHELAGFKYDSSLAFNDVPGYRFNIAFPFYPFDHRKGRKINVLQLPTFLMDGNLFEREGMTVDKALEEAIPYIDSIVKHKGLGVIDWHVRTSFPGTNEYGDWGSTYLKILQYLGSLSNVWVTSAEEVYKWLASREQKLIALAK